MNIGNGTIIRFTNQTPNRLTQIYVREFMSLVGTFDRNRVISWFSFNPKSILFHHFLRMLTVPDIFRRLKVMVVHIVLQGTLRP